MPTQQEAIDQVAAYLAAYPDERARLEKVFAFIEKPHDFYDRKNPEGHITASGIVLSQDGSKTLLVNHRFLGLYLQPGGHVDPEGTIAENALREIEEETAVPASALTRLGPKEHPIDIHPHAIPPNESKNEGPHFHFDFRYLFQLTEEVDLTHQEEEVLDLAWFGLDDPVVLQAMGEYSLQRVKELLG